VLAELKEMGLTLGVLTNRDREFMEQDIDSVGETGWRHFFDTMVCGDDVAVRKPSPDSPRSNRSYSWIDILTHIFLNPGK